MHVKKNKGFIERQLMFYEWFIMHLFLCDQLFNSLGLGLLDVQYHVPWVQHTSHIITLCQLNLKKGRDSHHLEEHINRTGSTENALSRANNIIYLRLVEKLYSLCCSDEHQNTLCFLSAHFCSRPNMCTCLCEYYWHRNKKPIHIPPLNKITENINLCL